MALRSGFIPRVGVYVLQPLSMALLAALLMKSLASPSNSPAAKLMTSTPDNLNSLASSRILDVLGGIIFFVRSARYMVFSLRNGIRAG